jgi:hypothetical protein
MFIIEPIDGRSPLPMLPRLMPLEVVVLTQYCATGPVTTWWGAGAAWVSPTLPMAAMPSPLLATAAAMKIGPGNREWLTSHSPRSRKDFGKNADDKK